MNKIIAVIICMLIGHNTEEYYPDNDTMIERCKRCNKLVFTYNLSPIVHRQL